jgi:hypothetical protein
MTAQTKKPGDRLAFPAPYEPYGLTKRELFAAMAMQAVVSNPEYLKPENQQQILTQYGKDEAQWSSLIAWMALDYADALLAELAKDGAP